jgi:hypothetical protein
LKRATENHEACRAAIAILHYLRDHPTAKDNATGIAQWWVGEERDTVEKALAHLVDAGVIEQRRHIYQLSRRPDELG